MEMTYEEKCVAKELSYIMLRAKSQIPQGELLYHPTTHNRSLSSKNLREQYSQQHAQLLWSKFSLESCIRYPFSLIHAR